MNAKDDGDDPGLSFVDRGNNILADFYFIRGIKNVLGKC